MVYVLDGYSVRIREEFISCFTDLMGSTMVLEYISLFGY